MQKNNHQEIFKLLHLGVTTYMLENTILKHCLVFPLTRKLPHAFLPMELKKKLALFYQGIRTNCIV